VFDPTAGAIPIPTAHRATAGAFMVEQHPNDYDCKQQAQCDSQRSSTVRFRNHVILVSPNDYLSVKNAI
jgi:hypothetical protein